LETIEKKKGRPFGSKKISTVEQAADIQVTRIFQENLLSEKKIIVNRGGARSSKSYSIMQLLVDRFFSLPGRQILIARKTSPALRRSCYRDCIRYLKKLDLYSEIQEEKSLLAIHYNDALIQFVGLDDPEKIKSTGWNDIFMEEANEFDYEDFIVLSTRMSEEDKGTRNKLFMAFNPIDSFHWIKERLIDTNRKDIQEIHSSYLDNPFLSPDYIQSLLDLEEQDPNYFRIYGLGEWGKLENLIYHNWDIVDSMVENPDEVFYGLDFGFNAPSALIKIVIKDEELWEEELIYETGLTNTDLIAETKKCIPVKERPNKFLICDSAEPDRMKEFEEAGFVVVGADKNVKIGIDFVQRQKIHILRDSTNLIKEKRSYSWKVDKRTSRILDEPIKFNDHLMDAERYGIFTYYKEIGTMPGVRYL
jgi:phage terminase large subunit